MASASFLNVLLIVSAAPLADVDDEVAALIVELALPLMLLLLWLKALMAITVPPCALAGALLELVPLAADL